jgi:hypothetical protein
MPIPKGWILPGQDLADNKRVILKGINKEDNAHPFPAP